MKKLNGNLKKNIAVFISGRGSNLKSIVRYSSKKKTTYKVKVIISNKPNVQGLLFAKKQKIRNYCINFIKNIVANKDRSYNCLFRFDVVR